MSNPCGFAGTWALTWKTGGASYSTTVSGFSLDNPFYQRLGSQQGCSNFGVILSACDGRNMFPPRFSCNSLPTDFTFSFTPTNPDDAPHDCINGACFRSAQFGTPGLYQTLSQCEQVCGSKGCSGKCVSNADWARIVGLSQQNKNQGCK